MFEPTTQPRVFACPPGADFPALLLRGLHQRLAGQPPEALARVELFVNTSRMRRRILSLFDTGPARLLPRIRLVTDLAHLPVGAPPPVPPFQRKLEFARLIARLLNAQPDLAPRSALFDLAESLGQLLDEMHDEGVTPDAIAALDVQDFSGHWQRGQQFLNIVAPLYGPGGSEAPGAAARQRMAVERLIARWRDTPPQHPVLVAGSTGSRGTTALLMQAVAQLPQGAVILPGFDFDLPAAVWKRLDDALTAEDHPQFRFARLLAALGMPPGQVRPWVADARPPSPARNRLVSLALRPAPVTDQWLREAPALSGVPKAMEKVTLLEAPSPRHEALAIALMLREAAEQGRTAALVTPDRLLTRQVTAALDRWRIEPDASAGQPLALSAPGRLLRHLAGIFGTPLTAERLLIVLKHPLTASAPEARGPHLRWTRELEMQLRRHGPPFPAARDILRWAEGDEARQAWAGWVADTLFGHEQPAEAPLARHVARHLRTAEALAAGPGGASPGGLWEQPAGVEARRLMAELEAAAAHGGTISPRDYAALFEAALEGIEVRDPVRPHPGIMIWGTLEARVQGADLVILGGLNEGTWPGLPAPDPWLNRELRARAGLLVPERRIGLAAHDFQQAICAEEVVLCRALRDDDSETVPSRWLNRLVNLMSGMSEEGAEALRQMRGRGEVWLQRAAELERPAPVPPAPRPSPRPPVAARPRQLSVTAVTRLIRDPYAIYAERILGLKKLDPLHRRPDAPLRGTVLHRVFERFIREADLSSGPERARALLMRIADEVLAQEAPWPAARLFWRARLARVADRFLADEQRRQALATPAAQEVRGRLDFPEIGFTLTAKADRIDRTESGEYLIYDYKTGSPPTAPQVERFEKQLLLEAVMAEHGTFEGLAPAPVASVAYIGLGASPKTVEIPLEDGETARIRDEFLRLIRHYQRPTQGYTARRAVARTAFAGDYDHLARYGEWDETHEPRSEEVGHGPR